jgi:hypothetical protein
MARITNEQRIKLSVAPKTAAGRDAKIDGAVTFESSDSILVSIQPIDDLSAYAVANMATEGGAVQITATFDADLGQGVRTVSASGALEVVRAEAETAEIVFGDPELAP